MTTNNTNADPDPLVRPFMMTAGRSTSTVDDLRFETLVQVTGAGNAPGAAGRELRFEPARVHELCHRARSIAEISAALDLPIGTVKVLVGDLVGSGHLRIHDTFDTADGGQVEVLNRLVTGVKRLWQ